MKYSYNSIVLFFVFCSISAFGSYHQKLLKSLQSGNIDFFVEQDKYHRLFKESQTVLYDFINLSFLNKYKYPIDTVLKMVHQKIEDKIEYLEWHVQNKCKYDYKQLKQIYLLLAATVGLGAGAYYFYKEDCNSSAYKEFDAFKKKLEDAGVTINTRVTIEGDWHVTRIGLSKLIKASNFFEQTLLESALNDDCVQYSKLYQRAHPSFITVMLIGLMWSTFLIGALDILNLSRLDSHEMEQELLYYQELLKFVIELQKMYPFKN